MKLALQMYTLREYMKSSEQITETFNKIKEIGYDAVQVSGIGQFTREKAEQIKNECERLDINICATHTGLTNLLTEFAWIVEYHKLWNCQYVGVGMMPHEYAANKDRLIEFAGIMNTLGERLAKEGLKLVYHNHAFEFRKYDGKLGMEILKDYFNEYVQFEIDTYWVQKGGCNPVEWINNVAGKMDVVHFKDMGLINWDEQIMEVVGKGNLNWKEIINACKNNKVLWACVEQDDCQGRDPFMCAKESLFYLKGFGL